MCSEVHACGLMNLIEDGTKRTQLQDFNNENDIMSYQQNQVNSRRQLARLWEACSVDLEMATSTIVTLIVILNDDNDHDAET